MKRIKPFICFAVIATLLTACKTSNESPEVEAMTDIQVVAENTQDKIQEISMEEQKKMEEAIPTPEPLPPEIKIVDAADSRQELSYILYTPSVYDETTPVFMFLHGNGDAGLTCQEVMERYAYLQCLEAGTWQPGVIFITPVGTQTSHWAEECDNVIAIYEEVLENVGGSRDNLYLTGASAGADGLTVIAQNIELKGAIYMAGHLNGRFGNIDADTVMSIWSGKPLHYYRDNLADGGYGYSKEFIDSCISLADTYNVDFQATDLDWNHDIGLVDATFLPAEIIDMNGNPSHDAVAKILE